MQLATVAPASVLAPAAPLAPNRSIAPVATLAPDTAAGAQQRAASGDLEKYYATAQGKQGAELLRALHLIVRTGHVDRGYAQARDELFGDVADLDGDNQVEDVFTGELHGPITNRKDAYDRGLNTEHTWPQSKGATGIAQSDLHHLQPADIRTNERRGSHPYGEVLKVEWSTGEGPNQAKLGVDALGETVFEPRDSVKGDIARGLLYFYTRYSQSRTQDFTLENFRHELPTLLKWNIQDPVDDNERARNDEVQRVQGNRNPYIDHPEYVDAVGFGKLDLGK
ncbi:MAG: endonuclease [Thermoleophilia bacterium]|nr:endonuclease [Thermoleophilia bacterium]